MPSKSHQVRSLASVISEVEDLSSPIIALEDRLHEAGGSAPPERDVDFAPRPLFRAPALAFDTSAPEFQAKVAEARLSAMQSVQEINSRELSEISERYAATFMRMDEAIASIPKVITSEVVDLALLVAQEILHAELSVREDLVFDAVERALAGVPHDGTVAIRMNADDIEGVKRRFEEEGPGNMKWQIDSALRAGDCVVEMPSRIIDASLDARLEAVRDTLVRALMADEQEGESDS
ncbi:MAG: hypothetical protein GY811_24020 [Myxococcales bacterium]|nr:hypothetical protein [Myxococcales bacterium]